MSKQSTKSAVQKGPSLQFHCLECGKPISFSVLDHPRETFSCEECGKSYAFTDKDLNRQLKKFETLCRTILDSEEILANTSVGITVDRRNICVPYRILMTRFNSQLDLTIGDQPLKIEFRVEPLQDQPQTIEQGFES